jgi:flagellar biosynthesis protein FlhB
MADSSKTHDPTPRRRQQARDAGQVAHSQDLASAVLFLGALGMLAFGGAALVQFLAESLKSGLSGGAWKSWIDSGDGGQGLIVAQWNALIPALARLLVPVLAGAALAGVAVHLIQTGFLFRPERIVPDLSRVSPLVGLRRVFSGASFGRLALGVVKVGVVAAIACGGMWSRREELASLTALDPVRLGTRAWEICWSTAVQIGLALLALAAVDYLVERWRLEGDLRMTPQEIRDETRELEGNRQRRGRRREPPRKISAT